MVTLTKLLADDVNRDVRAGSCALQAEKGVECWRTGFRETADWPDALYEGIYHEMTEAIGSTRRRVAVFTGTRAEYGLLVPILRRLEQSEMIDVQLIVAGSHLSMLHGKTIHAIEDDGFEIDERIEMLLANDSATAITKSLGLGLIELGGTFERLSPDLLVVLGDRYEVLAAAIAALVANIPIAHLHGGEVTEGAFDDSVRHAITKLSHVHFVATEEFARRVRQLGEPADRVHVVGAPALDVIADIAWPTRDELSSDLGIDLPEPLVMLVYHPSTIPGEEPLAAIDEILAALDDFEHATVVCSLPNADPKFGQVRDRINEYAASRPNVTAVASLGHRRYLSLLRHASVIVGNSSSGIIEAPSLGTPTVNVGQRQKGRPVATSVSTVLPRRADVSSAVAAAIQSKMEIGDGTGVVSPYDLGVSVASRVVQIIENAELGTLVRKRFDDWDETES